MIPRKGFDINKYKRGSMNFESSLKLAA